MGMPFLCEDCGVYHCANECETESSTGKLIQDRSTKEKADWWDAVERAAEKAIMYCSHCVSFTKHTAEECPERKDG